MGEVACEKDQSMLNLRVYQEPNNENISILVTQGKNARDKVEVYKGHICRCPVRIHLRTLNKGVIGSTVLIKVSFWLLCRGQIGGRQEGTWVDQLNNHPLLRMEAWEIENKIDSWEIYLERRTNRTF